MQARLFSKWGETRGLEQTFADELTIGRRDNNGLVLDFSAVSGRHARIYFDAEEGGYMVEDLGSLNGTKVDGVRVQEPMRLARLNLLKFGRVCEFVFQNLAGAGATEATQEVEPEATPVRVLDVTIDED